jgi:two-component system, cell cycle response regulator DivK
MEAKVSRKAAKAEAGPSPLVLVVDDYADNREMYALYLRHMGYRVEEAEDGEEALEKAFACTPDLIVMDLSLPSLDGWEATRRLKADARTRQVPVIAVTGHAFEGQSQVAAKAGCDAFVTKPCEPKALESTIRRVLSETGPARERKDKRGS